MKEVGNETDFRRQTWVEFFHTYELYKKDVEDRANPANQNAK